MYLWNFQYTIKNWLAFCLTKHMERSSKIWSTALWSFMVTWRQFMTKKRPSQIMESQWFAVYELGSILNAAHTLFGAVILGRTFCTICWYDSDMVQNQARNKYLHTHFVNSEPLINGPVVFGPVGDSSNWFDLQRVWRQPGCLCSRWQRIVQPCCTGYTLSIL